MRKILAIFMVLACLLIAMPIEKHVEAGGQLAADQANLAKEQRGMHSQNYTVDGNVETIYKGSALVWNPATDKVVTRLAGSTTAHPAFVGIANRGTTSATGKVEVYHDYYYKIGTSRTITGSPEIGAYVYLITRKDKQLSNPYVLNASTAALTVGTSCTFTNGSKNVTGVGTKFTEELNVGDDIYGLTDGVAYTQTIDTITSDTALTIDTNYGGTGGADTGAYGVYVSGMTTNATETYGGTAYYNMLFGKIAEYNATDSWIIHVFRDLLPPVAYGGSVTGNVVFTLGAGQTVQTDAATTDHTSAFVQLIDLDINSANVEALRINCDVGTALSAAEVGQGLFVDVNGIAANANTSLLYAYNSTLTHTSTDRADVVGVKVLFDGIRDTDDTSIGFYHDGGTTTLNSASAVYHGFEFDLASVVDTDFSYFYGGKIDMPATYQGTDPTACLIVTGNGVITALNYGTTSCTGLYSLADTTTANALQTLDLSRDINGTVAGAVALTEFANILGQAVLHSAGDFVVTQTATTAGVLQINLAHNTNVATAAPDVFASTGLAVNVTCDVNDAGADLDITAAAAIFNYTVDETSGVVRMGASNVVLITSDIPTGLTSAGAFDFDQLEINADAVILNDANITFAMLRLDGSAMTHTSSAAAYGMYINGTFDEAIRAVGYVSADYFVQNKYYWCDDFNEEIAAVTVNAGLRTDEWVEGGTNHAVGNATYLNGVGGQVQLLTNGAANDSSFITHLPIILVNSNPIVEFRFQTDDITASHTACYCGFVETAGFVDKDNIEAQSDDFILVGFDSENGHTFGADRMLLVTDDNGGSGAGGTIEDMGAGQDIAVNTYVTVRIDCTDTEQPRVWIDVAGGAIDPSDEIDPASITGTIQAGIIYLPIIFVQGINAAAEGIKVDYIKIWSDR